MISMIPHVQILPQYGSVSAPFFNRYRGLISNGAGTIVVNDGAPALIIPHALDRFLGTSAEDAENATYRLRPHQVVAALADHIVELQQMSGSRLTERLQVDQASGVADLLFQDHGLKIQIGVGPDAVSTLSYVIATDMAGLCDFIKASLTHYNNVPKRYFDGVADFVTATSDEVMLAASLIYHQQFLQDGSKGPFDFFDLARALTISDQLAKGQNHEHAWVPSLNGDPACPVEVKRFADGRVQITIRNTADHGKPNMPLFGNVLVLGARELSNGFKGLPFLDSLTP